MAHSRCSPQKMYSGVAQADREDALCEQFFGGELALFGIAEVVETLRKPRHQRRFQDERLGFGLAVREPIIRIPLERILRILALKEATHK